MDLSTKICLPCVTENHWECYTLVDNNCCCDNPAAVKMLNQRGGPIKEDHEVTDPLSTGRKRAAVAYPLEEGMTCEWASLKNAGGGFYPIVGCPGNPAVNRHHGPDKNTLNNDSGNVHRICSYCHNRWHARNDPVYSEFFGSDKWQQHDSETRATQEEVLESELYWQKNPATRMTKEIDH